jgi:hypothetical protein
MTVLKFTAKALIPKVANWILNPNLKKSNATTNLLLIIMKCFKIV